MGLTEDDTVVLVVAGSWGVGDIGATARAIRDAGAGTPVVLCGRNDALVAELDREPGVIALGWTTEVRRLLAAADVLVHNAGGLSCLEGFAMGVPVIGYACLPGHGHRNSLAMDAAGVAVDAQSVDELVAHVRRLARTPEGAALARRARALFVSDPTDELLALAATVPDPVGVPAARTWALRAAAVATGVPVTMGALSFGVAQATVHGGLGLAHGQAGVYVAAVVDAAQLADPAVVTALREQRVSAAVRPGAAAPTPTDVRMLLTAGVTVVGTDLGVDSRNPNRLRASMDAAVQAVAATEEHRAKVVCLRPPGMVEHVAAWEDRVQLAYPRTVVTGGQAPPTTLSAGQQVVLDERGRTAAQVLQDLTALADQLDAQHLRQEPMRALWSP